MSDEAFARRFYSDRAELVSLGVPLDSQRDEFTGEELYTLRAERYFLPELELDDEELAALQTCFFLLEGRFAYAEPLRLALQNLALGRSAGPLAATPTGHRGPRRGARPRLLARAAGPARQARGRDLEAAHRQVPLLVDLPRRGRGAHAQPVRAAARERLVVRDRPRSRARRHPHVPRLAHPLRHPVRDAARARLPAAARVRRRELPRPRRVAVRRHRRRGADRGRARHGLVGRARLRRRAQPRRGRRLHDRVRVVEHARALDPSPGRPRGAARAVRAAPSRHRGRTRRSHRARGRPAHSGRRGRRGRERRRGRALRRPGRPGALRRAAVAARLPPDRRAARSARA